MKDFEKSMKNYQTTWRSTHLPLIIGNGEQNGVTKPYILLNKDYRQSFFPDIRDSLFENQTLSQIRDSILPKLMSGKIRVPIIKWI